MKILLIAVALLIFTAETSAAANIACRVSTNRAKKDLAASLARRYPSSYTTQKKLLDQGMESYSAICRVPSNKINNGILENLNDRYYPNFNTIWILYQSNLKSYKALNPNTWR
ncbi:MAG: hypothetical protein P1P81_08195 [Desulfobulbales bacterium]|nr:hypothetical protein [Desulfobulbales bacterium]